MQRPVQLLLLVLLGLASPLCPGRDKQYESTSSDKRIFLFFQPRPEKDNPQDQLDYAKGLLAKGARKSAAKELHYLALKWPGAPEVAEAVWLRAKTLEEMGKLNQAFEEYETLVTRFSGEAPYGQALTNQWRIAETIETRRRAAFLLFKGFTSPEQAIPYYESIVKNAPSWERAPELLYRVGEIQRNGWESETAIATFNRIIALYPQSPFAEKAAYAKALCSNALAEDHPNHEEHARAAWSDITFYLTRFEKRNHTTEAMDMQAALQAKLARFAFEKAEFYDRIARRPAAALAAYEAFVRDFPVSEWTERARARITELRPTAPAPSPPHEKS